jgi:hypothetical protein
MGAAGLISGNGPAPSLEMQLAYQNAAQRQAGVGQQWAAQYVPPEFYDIPNMSEVTSGTQNVFIGNQVAIGNPEPDPYLSADATLERRFAGLDFADEPTQAPIPRMQEIARCKT